MSTSNKQKLLNLILHHNSSFLPAGKSEVGNKPKNKIEGLAQFFDSADWQEITSKNKKKGEMWLSLETEDFSPDFKAAAWFLHLYETTDFKSLNQSMHDEQVKLGNAKGPYVCRSLFNRLWSGDDKGWCKIDKHQDYRLTLIIKDGQIAGFSFWDRPYPTTRQHSVFNIPGARRNPTDVIQCEALGMSAFLVMPNFRGTGIGSRLAKHLTKDIQVWRETHPLSEETIPVIQAFDRAQSLMKHQSPNFEVTHLKPSQCCYASKMWWAYIGDLDRDTRHYRVKSTAWIKPKVVRSKTPKSLFV